MTLLQERLFAMQDKQYAAFQAKLTPGVPMESFIGIRVPVLRKFAKEFTKEKECEEFLHQLPHQYYDENMLHGLLISEVKDYEECIRLTDKFLPFVDNWAVSDIMYPKAFGKHLWRHDVANRPVVHEWQELVCQTDTFLIVLHLRDKESVKHVLIVVFVRKLLKEILAFFLLCKFFCELAEHRHTNAYETFQRHSRCQFGLESSILLILHGEQSFLK